MNAHHGHGEPESMPVTNDPSVVSLDATPAMGDALEATGEHPPPVAEPVEEDVRA